MRGVTTISTKRSFFETNIKVTGIENSWYFQSNSWVYRLQDHRGNRGSETRMRFLATITFFAVCILCILANPTAGIRSDLERQFYFPDQAEYVELSMKCPENTILWPANRRCYREGEQGPCNVGRVLILDRKYLIPVCRDTVF